MRSFQTYYGSSTDSPANSTGVIARLINNTSTDNLNWAIQEINQATRYLVTKYYFNERTYTVPGGTVAKQQFYNLPPLVKKVVTASVTIGGVIWNPVEVPTQSQWNRLNVITFYQDYPSSFYIYNGQIGLFPIPATTGNTLTLYYKSRIPDLSQPDVVNGTQTVTATNGSAVITATIGTQAVFKQWMGNTGWIRIPSSTTDSANGDNQWYQISSVTSGTQLVLANQYGGATATGAGFTIGDVSILPEDYQDLPAYRMAYIYYTTRFPDPVKANNYQKLWTDGVAALDEEFGSKTTSVILPEVDIPQVNPNLYQRSVTQN